MKIKVILILIEISIEKFKKISGMSKTEIIHLEIEFLKIINFKLFIFEDKYMKYYK
jgi:hypothetical protein